MVIIDALISPRIIDGFVAPIVMALLNLIIDVTSSRLYGYRRFLAGHKLKPW